MHTNAYTYVLCMNASENQNPSTPPHHLLQTLHSGLPERRRLRPVQRLRTAMHTYIQPTLQNKVRRLNGQLFVVVVFFLLWEKGVGSPCLGSGTNPRKITSYILPAARTWWWLTMREEGGGGGGGVVVVVLPGSVNWLSTDNVVVDQHRYFFVK